MADPNPEIKSSEIKIKPQIQILRQVSINFEDPKKKGYFLTKTISEELVEIDGQQVVIYTLSSIDFPEDHPALNSYDPRHYPQIMDLEEIKERARIIREFNNSPEEERKKWEKERKKDFRIIQEHLKLKQEFENRIRELEQQKD